ncbi:MAG: CRTAC1 family protein [Alphaproteobacteria bacterium]|nr:CRTAC1 family protein [Alphaproteobacteria bacterium]
MKRALLPLVLVLAAASTAHADGPTIPRFVEDTKSSGLHSVYKGEWQYMVGGGVATFDCNGDGFPDLYIAGGENPAKLYVNTSKKGGPLKFAEAKSGAELKQVTGAYPVDIDGDGIMDLVVLRVGQSKIFRGLGHCKFEDVTAKWNVDGGDAWATAFSATWEKGNRWPTLAFGTYIDRAFENEPWGHCTDNWLLRPNEGQAGFGPRIALKPSYCALSMLFTDWNRSGTPSLRVANDREYYEGGQEQLWKVNPGEAPRLYTADEGWKFQRFWGMGIAAADLTGNGYNAYFTTSMADQRLQFLSDGPQKPSFKDAPFTMGTSAHRPFTGGDQRPSTGWHAQFEDVNNDGLWDLFIAKGNVDKMPDFAQKDPSNLLLQQADGSFVEGAEKAGLINFGEARGAAVADFNLDGKMDVLIVNRHENVRLWRGVSPHLGHWLGLRLNGDGANRDGIGAWIELKEGEKLVRREITVGGGHVSGINSWWHFGLGDQAQAQLRVIWPDGTAGDWQDVKADGFYFLQRGKPPAPFMPR